MNRRRLIPVLLTAGIIIGGTSLSTAHKNVNLLAHAKNTKIEKTVEHKAEHKVGVTQNQISQAEQSGLQIAYIGEGEPTFSFAATDKAQEQAPISFASPLQKQLYEYLSKPANQEKTMQTALKLHNGNPNNTCVLFQSSALRANGVNIPTDTAYTTVFMGNLLRNGWERRTDFNNLQAGDICFASTYHTFMFMGWADKEHKLAYVMGNEAYMNSEYYKERHLDGYNDHKNISQYKTTSYYKYVGKQDKTPVLSGKIIGGTVTLKSQAYDNGSNTGTVNYGQKVAILDQQGAYYKVDANGQIGWVYAVNIIPTGIMENYQGHATSDTGSKTHTDSNKVIGTATINSDNGLWLLQAPHNGRITVMPYNATVKVIERDGDWTKVNYNGTIGWAYSQYLTNVSKPVEPTKPVKPSENKNYTVSNLEGTATITTDVYLNNIPFATFDGGQALTTLHNGDKINIIGKSSNGWYKATFNGKTGFVRPKYTKDFAENKPAPKPTPKPEETGKNYTVNNLTGSAVVTTDVYLNNIPFATFDGGKALLTLHEGDKINIVGKSSNDWYKATFNGQTGFVRPKYTKDFTSGTSDNKPAPTPKPTPAVQDHYIKVNSWNGLWLLGGPNVSSAHYEVMPNNSKLKVLGTSGNWTKVDFNGTIGWCYTEYTTPVANETSNQQQGQLYKVNSNNGLWLLGGPGVSSEHYEVMPYDANVTVIGQSGNWSKVIYAGKTGWCFTKYITKFNPSDWYKYV